MDWKMFRYLSVVISGLEAVRNNDDIRFDLRWTDF